MKTTDPRDPLDRKLDELLSSQPIKAPDDFLARTLAAIDEEPEAQQPKARASLIRFTLPIAAAIAVAFVATSVYQQSTSEAPVQITTNNTSTPLKTTAVGEKAFSSEMQNNLLVMNHTEADELSDGEIDELLLLADGLSGFAGLDTESLNSTGLLSTLDSLYSI